MDSSAENLFPQNFGGVRIWLLRPGTVDETVDIKMRLRDEVLDWPHNLEMSQSPHGREQHSAAEMAASSF